MRQQIQRKKCELFVRTKESIEKSMLVKERSFYSLDQLQSAIPEVIEDLDPKELLFNGQLEDALGCLGQFKHANMEDVKEDVPGYLKTKPRVEVLGHLKEPAHNSAEEKSSDKTATEAMNESESNKGEFNEPNGLIIIINKETKQVESIENGQKTLYKRVKKSTKKSKSHKTSRRS